MDCLEAAAICVCICFQSAGGKLIIVKRLWDVSDKGAIWMHHFTSLYWRWKTRGGGEDYWGHIHYEQRMIRAKELTGFWTVNQVSLYLHLYRSTGKRIVSFSRWNFRLTFARCTPRMKFSLVTYNGQHTATQHGTGPSTRCACMRRILV